MLLTVIPKSGHEYLIRNILRKFLIVKTPQQKAEKQLFSIKLGKDDIVIDCGAHIGNITQRLFKSGATIYCFEPNPYAFKVLQDRFSNIENVHCIQRGVSDKNGRMKLYLHENSDEDKVHWSTGSSLLPFKGNININNYVDVEVIDLCEFIESLNNRVRILKMDVEGAECPIIEKIIINETIYKIDYVFVETHEHKIPELKVETDTIRELIKQRRIENINLDWR